MVDQLKIGNNKIEYLLHLSIYTGVKSGPRARALKELSENVRPHRYGFQGNGKCLTG